MNSLFCQPGVVEVYLFKSNTNDINEWKKGIYIYHLNRHFQVKRNVYIWSGGDTVHISLSCFYKFQCCFSSCSSDALSLVPFPMSQTFILLFSQHNLSLITGIVLITHCDSSVPHSQLCSHFCRLQLSIFSREFLKIT